jgi:hypothetical protein
MVLGDSILKSLTPSVNAPLNFLYLNDLSHHLGGF